MDSLVLSRAQMETFLEWRSAGEVFLDFKYLGSRLPEIGPRSSQLSVASLHLCDILSPIRYAPAFLLWGYHPLWRRSCF